MSDARGRVEYQAPGLLLPPMLPAGVQAPQGGGGRVSPLKHTVCVDPGLRCTGLAVYLGATLIMAAAVENPHSGRGPEAWKAMAASVVGLLRLDPAIPKDLVVEKMVSYPGSPVRVDDLMELVGVTGAIVGAVDQCGAYTSYLPRQWKKTVPKPIHNKRVLAKLTPAESAPLASIRPALVHNAVDAVGLGLFHLGRIK